MSRKLPFTFEEFKSIYSRVPRVCVDLVIKTHKGVLLTLRNKNGFIGKWHLPGGTVFYREPIEDAVHRIAHEELGVRVNIDKFQGFLEYFSEEKERGFGYSVALVFVCSLQEEMLSLDDQATKVEFFLTPPENTVKEQIELLNKLK